MSTRAQLSLPAAVWARSALCTCQSLGLQRESVVVSADAQDRLVLQSLSRPELGRLLLRQLQREQTTWLIGGDENWKASDVPEVEVSLLVKGGQEERDVEEDETVNQLVYAALHGNLEDMKEMLLSSQEGEQLDLDTSFATTGPYEGYTCLHAAAFMGREEVVDWLLEVKKCNVNLRSKEDKSVVYYCVQKQGNVEILKKLMKRRADGSEGNCFFQTEEVLNRSCKKLLRNYCYSTNGAIRKKVLRWLLLAVTPRRSKSSFSGRLPPLSSTLV